MASEKITIVINPGFNKYQIIDMQNISRVSLKNDSYFRVGDFISQDDVDALADTWVLDDKEAGIKRVLAIKKK